MTGFNPPLDSFGQRTREQARQVFVQSAEEVQRSVVEGSEITGAPGQPVDTGALRASWTPEYESASAWRLTSKLAYAQPIEDGVGPHGPLTLRSAVGGFYSIALTIAGWPRILEAVTRRVVGR